MVVISSDATGQIKHNRVRSDMAPGLAAERYRKADPDLATVTQPVRIFAPTETTISVLSNGRVLTTSSSSVTVGLAVGPVYQVKVSGLNLNESVELYPSIELLGRLYPPAGLENRFPIEIEITRDDLLQVIDGSMVTKVIYLEHGDMVVPHQHSPDVQPTFDVGANEDPLRASQSLGRPMAILRIGSRVPLNGNPADTLQTIGPAPVLLPEPVQFSLTDQLDRPTLPRTASGLPNRMSPSNLPPVVTTNRSTGGNVNALSAPIRN